MVRTALVAGMSGGFGGAMAAALRAEGWQVVPYRRGSDMAAAAKGAQLIVNGLNPPRYHAWDRLIPEITEAVLAAARVSGALVLVPGNVYVYGREPGPWGPATPHRPVSRKGRIRAEMEASYREAAAAGRARVLILRGGEFLRPGAHEGAFAEVVLKPLAKGRITSLGDPAARRAHAYLPDMARAAAGLLQQDLPDFVDMPFAGHCFSMLDLAAEIGRATGRTPEVSRFPWWQLRLAAPVWELARELLEMRYLYDLPHALDAAPLAAALPGLPQTPLAEVVRALLRPAGPAVQPGAQGSLRSTQTG